MIKVQAADGSIREVNGEITLEKGDKVFIDGKLVDAENITVGDNQLIVVINGQTVIINNTDIFSENTIGFNAGDGFKHMTSEHTAIIFEEDPENSEQDNIIDEMGNLVDFMETAAGEDSEQTHSYIAKFAEREGAEVNVEASLNEREILNVNEDNAITVSKGDLLANIPNVNNFLEIGNITTNIGTISEKDGIYTIQITDDYKGTIEVNVTATDGQTEVPGKALITVNPINGIMEASFINPSVLEDTPVEIDITTADFEEDKVEVTIFSQPDNGTASYENGILSYTPVKDYNGEQEITIKITDGENIKYETIQITVSPVNDEPTIEIVNTLEVQEDNQSTISFNIDDIDGDNTSFNIQEPEHGTILIDGTTINYFPDENYSGADSITIDYTDGTIQKSSTLNINVTEVNDLPYIEVTNEVHMVEDEVQEILMNTGDIEGSVDIKVQADNGAVIVDEDGDIVYSPNKDFNGIDTIIVTATDEDGVITTKNINVQIDNDNSDIAFEIRTETLSETHTEIVTHTETRDIEVQHTREVEVIDEEANTNAGITYNSEDGKYYRTEEETEVYTETVKEERTRDVQETFTNTRVEQEEFQDTRDVSETFTNTRIEQEEFQDTRIIDNPDTIGIRNTEVVNSEAMKEAGFIRKNINFNESFEDNNVRNWGVIDDKDWDETSGIEIQNNKTLGNVDASDGEKYAELDTHGTDSNTTLSRDFDTSAVNSLEISFDYFPRTGNSSSDMSISIGDKNYYISYDGTVPDGVTVTDNGEWNTYTLVVDTPDDNTQISFNAEGKEDTLGALLDNINVSGEGSWVKETTETFTNTRIETTETFNITYDDGSRNANNVNANSTDDALKIANGRNFFHNMLDRFTGNDDTTPDSLVFKNVNNSSFNLDNDSETFVVQGNSNNLNLNMNNGDNTVIFETNPGATNINAGNGTDVLVLPGNQSDYNLDSLNNNILSGQIIGPDNMALTINNFDGIVFADGSLGDVSSVMTITETEVPFEDTRTVFTQATDDQIIYETEEYIVDDNVYEETFTNTRDVTVEFEDTRIVQEEFTNTRDVTVEFEDTRIVQETYEVDVDYERERLVETDVEVEPITKMVSEDYTTTEEEEYTVLEDVEVTNSSNELILDLSGSEINIDYNLVSGELPDGQEINTINLGENKLENISLDDIMVLTPDEEITFNGEQGSSINFSELPESAQIQSTGEVEKDGEVYNTYSYTDNSIGQELDMMINQNIVTDL